MVVIKRYDKTLFDKSYHIASLFRNQYLVLERDQLRTHIICILCWISSFPSRFGSEYAKQKIKESTKSLAAWDFQAILV